MKNIIRTIIILIIGGIFFEMLCSGTEYIILGYFGVKTSFYEILLENYLSNSIIYLCIFCSLFILNCIYNYLIVKKLNSKLKILKERKEVKDEKK